MRHGNVGRWTLALALGLGGLGAARGEEPGRWWARPFARRPAEKLAGEPLKASSPGPAPTLGAQLTDAHATLQRRQEVCDKLREIAHDTGDEALGRKAEQLDQRAWDAYVRQTGKLRGSGGAGLDETVLQQRLGTDAAEARAKLASGTAGGRGPTAGGQAALREE